VIQELIAQSALAEVYANHGAEMAAHDGCRAPSRFASVEAEVTAARTALAVGEELGVSVLDVVGSGVPELAGRLGAAGGPVGAAASIDLGAARAARWLRLTREHARVLVPRASAAAALDELEAGGGCLHTTDVSSGLTTLAVTGPRSPDLLARLVRLDLDPRVFADHAVALTGAAGIPLQVLRWDRGPLLAYELMVGRDVAEYFWETVSHAGDGLGLRLIGYEALSRLTND
jgi:glycine cleavage system aminomethyltransferase T